MYRTALSVSAVVLLAALRGYPASRPAAPTVPFTQVTVDASPPSSPWYKMVGDLNGDGQLDIIVAGSNGPLVWYAYPNWTKTQIASGGWDGVRGEAADIDGDGDADIVMGGVVWFRNPRNGGGSWTMIRIDTQPAHDAITADLDLDGRLDVVCRDQSAFSSKTGNAIHIYRQVNPTSWTKRTLSCPHGEGIKLADIDRDGYADIVIGATGTRTPAIPSTARGTTMSIPPAIPTRTTRSKWPT